MRDPESGNSKGYAFVNFASFEASDMALEAMNGQYLCNRAITCSYAFKKDAKGELNQEILLNSISLFRRETWNCRRACFGSAESIVSARSTESDVF